MAYMSTDADNRTERVMPAEWERQSAVQLTWPHAHTDWRGCMPEITAVYVALASAVSNCERLLIVTPRPDDVRASLLPVLTPVQMSRVTFHRCDTDDTWARDHGFITVRDGGRLHLLDFRFNGWGEKYAAGLDNAVNRSLYDSGIMEGSYEYHGDFVLEGGAVESDGAGTLMTTVCCMTAPHRNEPLRREDIDSELRRRLGAGRVIWIDARPLTGDDTDGHIDTLVRFAPDDTMLYVHADDPRDEHYDALLHMERQLRQLRTADGRPYRLVRLPMPDAVYHEGERLPASYANFLVINDAVIIPTYGQPRNDAMAVETISAAFPDRRPVTVDSRVLIRQHGSVHCCAMQYFLK